MRRIIAIISAINAVITFYFAKFALYLSHKLRRMKIYIYQQDDWPNFTWDSDALLPLLGRLRNMQGKLTGKMEMLGFELRDQSNLGSLSLDVIKSSEIEGEVLRADEVRSSVARRLGMDIAGLVPSDRNVDGVVEMILDAVLNSEKPLSAKRLFDWHSSLFPLGKSGMLKIITGDWRNDSTGPMQVVSGALGKEKVHYQTPAAATLNKEMTLFINWVNNESDLDPVIKAALAHFWFVTLHPFEDGNGRIARAIADMLLTRADGISQRFYSMSAQIRLERNEYYSILEKSQKGKLDITAWLKWFLNCLLNAINTSEKTLGQALYKHTFWNLNATIVLNERQIIMLNRLLDGFDGKLTSSKWAKITKCSADTALRDIQDLIKKEILQNTQAGGRSTNYELKQKL
jgi:Fic family protein